MSLIVTPKARIRKITPRAYRMRFTPPERVDIYSSNDDIVIDMQKDLELSSYIDIDNPDVYQSLQYLLYLEILPSKERIAEIMKDGKESET